MEQNMEKVSEIGKFDHAHRTAICMCGERFLMADLLVVRKDLFTLDGSKLFCPACKGHGAWDMEEASK